ncbi:MAG: PH domain-containing protein [Woeseiaceae bacterium]|nr:PH domain-containing protein [Woeseiaceae bacterium]
MSKADALGWQRASPLAVVFFIGRIVQAIVKNAVQSLAPLAAFLVAYRGDVKSMITIIATVATVALIVSAVLRYWFFRFRIEDEQIRIREGVVRKKQLDIKFDRIQGVNTEQNFIFRIFNLFTVRFDTAGSAGEEGYLPAVRQSLAEDLQSRLRLRTPVVEAEDEAQAVEDASPEKTLLRLGLGDMVRIGLADRRALLVFAFLGPVFEQMGEQTQRAIADYAETAAGQLAAFGYWAGVMVVVGFVLFILILLAGFSIIAAVLRYHDFQLSFADNRLRAVGGLLTRHENTMRTGKVQVFRARQGLVMRMFGRFKLSASQAASGKTPTNKTFTVPVADLAFTERLHRLIFDEEGRRLSVRPDDARFLRMSPMWFRSRVLQWTLPPAMVIVLLTLATGDLAPLRMLLFVPLTVLLTYQAWSRFGYLYDEDGLVRRSGLFGWRVDAFLFRKVQRITIKQSPFQRRRGVATLRMYLASGSVRLPYIDARTATELRDYILFKVESSQRAWH